MGQTVREFNFGAGNPAPEVFPAEALGAAAQRVIARSGPELAHYPDPRGEPELRAIAVERMDKVHGLRPSIDDVVITNGSMQGLILSAQGLAHPGDAVVVEEFCYGGTIRVFKRYGLELLGVDLDDDGMRMDALAELLERQQAKGRLPAFIYTTASYQNPTGTTQPRARRLELLALARRYHLPIVEDDTYADISFDPLTEPAIYSVAEPGEVVYLSSFSKILGPGLRLGYFIAPEPLRSRLLEWKIDGGTSGLSQRIVAEYLGAELWPHVEEGREKVKAKRNALLDALETETGDLHLRWTRPEGGLFVWIELPPEVERARLKRLAEERHIIYATGQAFDAAGEDVAYLRLAFGWIAEADIADGVRALVECIREAMPATAGARAG